MDNLIEFAKEQSVVFPEDSDIGIFLRDTIKILQADATDTNVGSKMQAEPCEDAVSRKEIQQKINRLWNSNGDKDYCMETLRDFVTELSPVTPTQNWIPVNERLPEENGFYLATYDGEICGENEPFVGLAEYENGKWVDDEEDYQCVSAWLPLPQPYKESEDK